MIFKRSSLLFLLSIALVGADTSDKTNLRKKYEEKNIMLEETESNVEKIPEVSLTNPNLLELNTEHTDTHHRRTGAITVSRYTNKKSNSGFDIGMQANTNKRCNLLQKQTALKNITHGGASFLKIRHAHFSERFDGLRQVEPRGVIGMSDHLEGTPSNPLTLVANFNTRENLYVEPFCEPRKNGKCGIQIKGRGPTGFRGPGAMSIMFKEDKSTIQLRFASNGASKATVLFFRRDGSYIDQLDVDIMKASKYNFYHGEGQIAGMSIFPLGDNLTWHKFSLTGLCYEEGRW